MKEIKLLHLFPQLLSLYGEYGNIAVLQRTLEENGCSVTVDHYEAGELIPENYDFIYIGSGTEDNLLEAIRRLMPHQQAIAASIQAGKLWLATGNAMAVFGSSVLRDEQRTDALGCFAYTTQIQDTRRYLGDAVSQPAFGARVIGFVNTSCIYHEIANPLLLLQLGNQLGNDKQSGMDGIREANFYGTQLIGPVLAKNPHFLTHICQQITGKEIVLPKDSNAQKAYDVALSELTKRIN